MLSKASPAKDWLLIPRIVANINNLAKNKDEKFS